MSVVARAGRGRTLRARFGAWFLRPRVLLALIGVLLAFGGGWLWFRGSSLVAVTRVTVTGVSGTDAGKIRQALEASARSMTTLDVSIGHLRNAVAPYPVVKDISVTTQFPHGMRITVYEQRPVGAIVVAGQRTAVAADGTLLPNVPAPESLPAIPVRVLPGGNRVSAAGTRHAVAVLAAAPDELRRHITQVITVSAHGLVAQVRNGPTIYFGDASRLEAKWAATTAVLADHRSAGARYIDVTDPVRPAAGPASSAAAGSTSTASSTGTPATASLTTQTGG